MSVGKTTLVNALKELPEFKDYHFRTERSKHLMNLGIPLNTDSTLKGQLVFASERAAELMQEKIITDRTVFHSEEGPALINKEQKRKEYYLNGIEYDFDTWNEIMKGKEGLPWYKQSGMKGARH